MTHIALLSLLLQFFRELDERSAARIERLAGICGAHMEREIYVGLRKLNSEVHGEIGSFGLIAKRAEPHSLDIDLFRDDLHLDSSFLDSVVGTPSVVEARHLRQWWGGGATRILPNDLEPGAVTRNACPAPFSGAAS